MEYEIIDNALPVEHAENIKRVLMGGNFPWFYQSNLLVDEEWDLNQYYFTHEFYQNFSWNSEWAGPLLEPILSVLKPVSLMRIKANFYPRTETQVKNGFHADQPFSHRGALYYVNSNDGCTIFEDGTEIESIENRILLFDSSKLHRSTHCTNRHGRVNINFNFF